MSPISRRATDGWCLPASLSPRSGVIGIPPNRRLTLPKWRTRPSAAGYGGGRREPARAVPPMDPVDRTGLYLARECPSWCISIDSHAEPVEGLPPGARDRTQNVLDRFAIDWSLCMYCGICIEECPYDALEWVGEPTQPGFTSEALVEEMVRPPS